jgi:hypothetical protein
VAARARRPTLEHVLANVRRGRVAYLVLTAEQKRALKDADGRVALDVLRHLLGARPANPERFPLTGQEFQAVARKLGYIVGQKRCRLMVRWLLEVGVIGRAGHYRQPYRNAAVRSGFCVALYRVGHRLQTRGPRPLSKRQRPVGTAAAVKPVFRLRWWQHPLFGDLLGLPPPHLPRRTVRRMRSLDEVSQGGAVNAAFETASRVKWLTRRQTAEPAATVLALHRGAVRFEAP